MLRLVASVLLCSALAVCRSASADTIETLQFSSILNQNSPLTGGVSGDLTLDETTGIITAADFSAGTSIGRFDFTTPPASQTSGASTTSLLFNSDDGAATFDLLLPVSSLVGYTGSFICSTQQPCSGDTHSTFVANDSDSAVSTGIINGPNAITPEPGSLGLLGIGVLGSAGILRRKLTRALGWQ